LIGLTLVSDAGVVVPCSRLGTNLGIGKDTGKIVILVWFPVLTFASWLAANDAVNFKSTTLAWLRAALL